MIIKPGSHIPILVEVLLDVKIKELTLREMRDLEYLVVKLKHLKTEMELDARTCKLVLKHTTKFGAISFLDDDNWSKEADRACHPDLIYFWRELCEFTKGELI